MTPKKPITDWDKFRVQFVREALRKASFRWPPRAQAIKAARVQQQINPLTGRICWYVRCAYCTMLMLEREGKVDHVSPFIPVESTGEDLNQHANRMFPTVEGFQVLCKPCHDTKTKGENDARREYRKRIKE